MKQFVLGTAFEIGPNTFVFGANTPLIVPVDKKYKVEVAPGLIESGVNPVISTPGKIKFSKGVYAAVVVVNDEFRRVEVRRNSPELVAASLAAGGVQATSALTKVIDRFAEYVKDLPENSEMARVVAILGDPEAMAHLKGLSGRVSKFWKGIDWKKASAELEAAVRKNKDKIPEPVEE